MLLHELPALEMEMNVLRRSRSQRRALLDVSMPNKARQYYPCSCFICSLQSASSYSMILSASSQTASNAFARRAPLQVTSPLPQAAKGHISLRFSLPPGSPGLGDLQISRWARCAREEGSEDAARRSSMRSFASSNSFLASWAGSCQVAKLRNAQSHFDTFCTFC